MKNLTVAGSRPAFNDELPYLSMTSPNDNTAGGMLNGHGVGIAMAAIFAGMALVVAFAASDGAIFGQNFSSASDNSPVIDSETDDAAVLSRDAFDEGSGAASAPPESGAGSATLPEEEKRLRAIKDFPLSLSDRIFVNVDHDRDDEEQPADDAPEDEQDNTEQQGDDQTDDSSGEGSSGEDNSGSGSGNGSGSDSSGSGSNSTGSQGNSTSTQGPSENPDGGNSTSVETSVSLG